MPVRLGIAAASPRRSHKENDLHVLNFCSERGNDAPLLYLLNCGGRGGRERRGDDGLEFNDSELLLLPEQLLVAARANELLELVGRLYILPVLLLGK